MATVAKRPKNKPKRSEKRAVAKTKVKADAQPKKLSKDEERAIVKARKKKKKKQTEVSTAVALLGKSNVKRMRMTKEKLEEIAELDGEFKVDIPDLIAMVDDGMSAEDIQRKYLRAALVTVINLIPRMEEVAIKKKNESGAYALNALISQGREIISDLRAMESGDEIALRIATLVIDPAFNSIAQNILMTFSSIKDDIAPLMDESKAYKMREIFQSHGAGLGQLLDMARVTTRDRIQEMIE